LSLPEPDKKMKEMKIMKRMKKQSEGLNMNNPNEAKRLGAD
jgi:hypothetical protein